MLYFRYGLLLLILSFSSGLAAMEYELALGMGAPSPTGLSVKKWVDEENAISMFFEWSARDERFVGHLEFVTHDFEQIQMDDGLAPTYYGFGLRVRAQPGKNTVGIRIPVGVNYLMQGKPIGLFAELGPRADVIPETNFAVDMVIGIRYRLIP